MKDPRDIIIKPVVSEKSYAAYDENVYTFVVAPDANKIEIRKAVEELFGTQVAKVHTINRKGKRKRNRRTGAWATARDPEARHRHPRRRRGSHRHLRELTMPIRKRKPTSPGRRFQSSSDFAEVTKTQAREVAHEAEAEDRRSQLVRPHDVAPPRRRSQAALPHHRLQAEQGRRAREGRGDRVRPEPQRAHRAAALPTTARSATSSPAAGLEVGDMVQSGQGSEIRVGNALPLRYIPVGTTVHNVELKPGARRARWAAARAPRSS